MIDGAKSGCRFAIGLRSDLNFDNNPMGGSNIIKGTTEAMVTDGGDYKSYLINYSNLSYTGTGTLRYDSTKIGFIYMVPNHDRAWDLVNTQYQKIENKRADYKGTIWIKYIAFGSAADTVLAEKIEINGEDSILFASTAQKFTFTAKVLPEDATDKTFFWSTSDENIATIDGSGKLMIKSTGTVKVIATAQDGSGVIGEKTVKFYYPVGNEAVPGTDYAVYPNPAQETINIAGTSDLEKVELADMTGKIIKTAMSNKIDVVSIDLSDISAGVYFLKCYADNGEIITKKIVKQ